MIRKTGSLTVIGMLFLIAIPTMVPDIDASSSSGSCADVAIGYIVSDPSGVFGEGVIEFDTNGNMLSFTPWTPGLFCSGAAGTPDGFYMTSYGPNSAFYSVDALFIPTLIGYVGYSIYALTYDATTDTLYASGGTMNTAYLYTIDPETGAGTPIGEFGNGLYQMYMLACDDDGDMYGIDVWTDMFYSIDKTTGTATQIGPTGQPLFFGQDMAFDGDVLYVAGFTYRGVLFTCDVASGWLTEVGSFPGGIGVDAISFSHPAPPRLPVTTISLEGGMVNDSFASSVAVTLNATPGDYPLNHTYYMLDNTSWTTYETPFSVEAAGNHTIQFYSDDIYGLTEEIQASNFSIRYLIEIHFKGGIGVSVTLKNTGPAPINMTGYLLIPGLLPHKKDISEHGVEAGASVLVKDRVLGLGKMRIEVRVNGMEKKAEGFLIWIFLFDVKEGVMV